MPFIFKKNAARVETFSILAYMMHTKIILDVASSRYNDQLSIEVLNFILTTYIFVPSIPNLVKTNKI